MSTQPTPDCYIGIQGSTNVIIAFPKSLNDSICRDLVDIVTRAGGGICITPRLEILEVRMYGNVTADHCGDNCVVRVPSPGLAESVATEIADRLAETHHLAVALRGIRHPKAEALVAT